jgi:hypothetical protein
LDHEEEEEEEAEGGGGGGGGGGFISQHTNECEYHVYARRALFVYGWETKFI